MGFKSLNKKCLAPDHVASPVPCFSQRAHFIARNTDGAISTYSSIIVAFKS